MQKLHCVEIRCGSFYDRLVSIAILVFVTSVVLIQRGLMVVGTIQWVFLEQLDFSRVEVR